jgi:hypothetical protein
MLLQCWFDYKTKEDLMIKSTSGIFAEVVFLLDRWQWLYQLAIAVQPVLIYVVGRSGL